MAPSRRNPRLRLACLRCQRRKVKCDGELPACKHCRNAGVKCTDGESARLKELPRAYIIKLKRRISWLESVVAARCPDVDLAYEPNEDDSQGDGSTFINETSEDLFTPPTTNELVDEAVPLIQRHPMGSSALSHEIGLVSLGTNQDPRYIGPSSGHLLARVMFHSAPKGNGGFDRDTPFPTRLVEAVQGPMPLPAQEMAKQLCNAYFDFIHPQYPILHRLGFFKMLAKVFQDDSQDPIARFQIFMVLAIGSTVLSGRLKARIPGESYCISAMQYFDRLNLENSLQGLQCLLLLLVFSIHSPCVRLNVWYLNYHCIAALLDLGLQRDIKSGLSPLEQEMRAKIFWVIMTMDRTIATMMGRPIGLRDEGCDLRMPQGLSENESLGDTTTYGTEGGFDEIAYASHLFRATKLNSEIKYVANSVNQETPPYASPRTASILDWQENMSQRLGQWAKEIQSLPEVANHQLLRRVCQLRHHSLRMLLLRPSPAIPKPTMESLIKCHESACATIRIFDELYRKNLLIYTWFTFHSLVLSTITMLCCIKVVPEIAQKMRLDELMGNMSISLSILSATGEHWSGAKRSRDILDELGRATIRWLQDGSSRQNRQPDAFGDTEPSTSNTPNTTNPLIRAEMPVLSEMTPSTDLQYSDMGYSVDNPFGDFSFSGSFEDFFDSTESVNIDNMMQDLFQDLIPIYHN